MEKVIIIGGGASGLVAAIHAKNKTNEVIILERNNICGKKILVTGNGRCNYWNEDQNLKHYHSTNKDILPAILTESNKKQVLSFFASIGIVPKIKNGYYYPFSNQATSIKNALVLEAIKEGIKIKNNCLVTDIEKCKDKFVVSTTTEKIIADKLIIATGSKAAPKTGSDGMGYDFVSKFNHTIIKPLPALVQLKTMGSYLKQWAGIRVDVTLSLYENNNLIKKESGQLQLTDYGISGICTFNLSNYIARGLYDNKEETIKINFLPFLPSTTKEEYLTWLEERNSLVKNRTIKELLEGFLDPKLVDIILKQTKISINTKYNDLKKEYKYELINNLTSFSVHVIGTNSYEQAQVCSGGVPLSQIDPNTMQSKFTKNLYLVGEILDVDGDCGGYNLSFAWISGMIAGVAIKESCHD